VAETIGKLIDAGMTGANAIASVELLHLKVIDFDEEMARVAGSLKQSTKKLGLSLGDRCCLALGIVRGSIVVTADRLWSRLRLGIQVEVLR
jgi:PIN domain nuclease of toxin-antitoxin system